MAREPLHSRDLRARSGSSDLPEEDHVDRDAEVDRYGHSRYGEPDEDRDHIATEDGQDFSQFV